MTTTSIPRPEHHPAPAACCATPRPDCTCHPEVRVLEPVHELTPVGWLRLET